MKDEMILNGQTFEEWAEEQFRYDPCLDCGGRAEDHTPGILGGKSWYAVCRPKATEFTLTIKLGNAAMQDPADVAHALQTLAFRLRDEGFGTGGRIRDENGNTVGTWDVAV